MNSARDALFVNSGARRKAPKTNWVSRVLAVLIRLCVLAIVILIGFYFRGFALNKKAQTQALQTEETRLATILEQETLALKKQQQREARLLHDPVYLEYVARSELGLARPGETLILIDEPGVED